MGEMTDQDYKEHNAKDPAVEGYGYKLKYNAATAPEAVMENGREALTWAGYAQITDNL